MKVLGIIPIARYVDSMADVSSPAPPGEPPMTRNDKVFAQQRRVDDFAFGAEVVHVFDDMVSRSVPGYNEMQRMTGELIADFAQPGSNIYDLGCSTGTTMLAVGPLLRPDLDVQFIGIDSSPEMLAEAKTKLTAAGFPFHYDLRQADLAQGVAVDNASVVTMLLTLQFVRPLHRDSLVRSIYEGLNERGCLILIEKVLGENSTFNRLFIQHYYEFKRRNGYSDLEISQKREALENVLVPYQLEENKALLRRAGFAHVDVFFKWYNFCAIVAMK